MTFEDFLDELGVPTKGVPQADLDLDVVVTGDEIEDIHPYFNIESVRFEYADKQLVIETS